MCDDCASLAASPDFWALAHRAFTDLGNRIGCLIGDIIVDLLTLVKSGEMTRDDFLAAVSGMGRSFGVELDGADFLPPVLDDISMIIHDLETGALATADVMARLETMQWPI